jgi:ferric iron reductase protein FhuF
VSGASASLDAVEALVPFLRARRSEPEAGDLLAADLVASPDRLAEVVADSGEVRGSGDPQVLASLWWQGYSYRVAGGTLAAWVVAGSAPDPAAATGAGVGVGRGRPSSLVVGPHAEEVDDLEKLLDRLFAAHLDPMAEALRARHPIGQRLVWGNAAASIASCLGAVAGADGAPDELDARIDVVTAALPHEMAELGAWTVPHTDYRRTTCCLWWKTDASKGALCEDCSLR